MKVIDKYNDLKRSYEDFVVLIKSGSFYLTFGDDSIILNYLFSYQIKNDKLGFPISAVDKVKDGLDKNNINYIIFNDGDDVVEISNLENDYYLIFDKAQQYNYEKMTFNFLMERIKMAIRKDPNNYSKIKEFVDEL